MITTVTDYNLQDAFFKVLGQLKAYGKEVIVGYKNAGGDKTKELHPCLIEIRNPERRTLLYPKRGNNPFAVLAESYWVMAGRNDVEFLSHFLPRAVDFSDDGKVWRAGYGPRLRKWQGVEIYGTDIGPDCDVYYVDQIKFIVKQLTKNKMSRQAVMSIWNPAIEGVIESTKDWPCSNWIHFMIRDNKLDCSVVMRSNDVIWGWSQTNVYEFTVIQEVIARALGVEIGSYFHLSDSMHIYEPYYEKMDELIESYIPYTESFSEIPNFKFGYSDKMKNGPEGAVTYLDNYLFDVETMCNRLLKNESYFESIFPDLVNSFLLLTMYKRGSWDNYENHMKQIPYTDLKVACDYWYRKNILKEKDGGLNMIKKSSLRMQ